MKKLPWTLVLLLVFLTGLVTPVRADGIIIPPPCIEPRCPPPPPCQTFDCPPVPPRPMEQLVIRYHHVNVSIQDQLAVTHVDQVFYNPNDWPVEGTYVFPLPLDAVVTDFTLWVDGSPVKGEVLSAEEARQYYDETVRNLRDPALLEYMGRGAVRASVFPIQPQGERRIELEYSQVLTAQGGLVQYVYPLNTEKFSLEPLEDVSVSVEVRDQQAIRAVYSPSHSVGVDRDGDHHFTAGYEAKNVRPDSDFVLYYSLGESEAFHLFSYRSPADADDKDGFFMLLLAPKPGETQERVAKDVLLVLDRSGSMEGEPFRQAQSALRYILEHLNPEDRFYLQAFSTGLETYASGMRPASEVPEALAWVDQQSARGSTDINRALLEAAAAADRERPSYLIFLTDGLPTEGVVDTQQILNNFSAAASSNLRVFPFGVGYTVDTTLLDTLSQDHHGQSTYVRSGDLLDEALSAFYERISTPVLTDLSLDFGSLATFDLYPDPLPDLFSGSQVIVVGRYRDGGAADLTLRGQLNGEEQIFQFREQSFVRDSRGEPGHLDMLPRLWATRKIGYLLNHIRLQGPDQETIQQIVRLSVRYGIVTPYTSYLVTEPMPLGGAAQDEIAENAYGQAQAVPLESTGKGAVDRAAQEGEMQSADVAPQAPAAVEGAEQGSAIRVVGARTFVYQEGGWVDTTYDPDTMSLQKLPFLSEDYFRLLAARPDLSAALALGERITLVVDGLAYQVVQDDQHAGTIELPPNVTLQSTPLPVEPFATPRAQALATSVKDPTPDVKPIASAPDAQAPTARTCLSGLLPLALMLAVGWFLKKRQVQ